MASHEKSRNGSANGRRRRGRGGRGTPVDDDRPRGFEPDRMRRLWDDIDQARDNLGLGPTPPGSQAWSVFGIVGAAAGLASDAAGALTSGAAEAVRGMVGVLPDPFGIRGSVVSCARKIPIVGTFFDD
ncbi:MAG TPA: hypothetical protein VGK30_08820 [Candidatus Binatia bacterium]